MVKDKMKGSTVLITGGTGTFGQAFVERCIRNEAREIRVFSRDEKKQYDMAKLFDQENVKFVIGDIRDRESVDMAMDGVDYVFHAAAMKQIPACENFPFEAEKTNIVGSHNVIDSAIQHGVKKVVCLSTDKAVYPISTMGLSKSLMEKLALAAAASQDTTEICITRFGNLIASRGSVVPLFMQQAERGVPITVTDPDMTRFMMSLDEAMDLVEEAFVSGKNGDTMVKLSQSCSIGDLAIAVKDCMKLTDAYPIHIVGARPGERKHEALVTDEEAIFAREQNGYLIVPAARDVCVGIHTNYRSDGCELMPVADITAMIKQACAC